MHTKTLGGGVLDGDVGPPALGRERGLEVVLLARGDVGLDELGPVAAGPGVEERERFGVRGFRPRGGAPLGAGAAATRAAVNLAGEWDTDSDGD